MANEYIIDDTVCPSCGHSYAQADYKDYIVKCAACGYERMQRTPLQKKRESTVLKYYFELLSSGIMKTMMLGILIIPIAATLWILLGPKSFEEIWATHRVGAVIYIFYATIGMLAFVLVIINTSHVKSKVRNHGYDMDWVRSRFRKKNGGYKRISMKLWGLDLKLIESEIKKYK